MTPSDLLASGPEANPGLSLELWGQRPLLPARCWVQGASGRREDLEVVGRVQRHRGGQQAREPERDRFLPAADASLDHSPHSWTPTEGSFCLVLLNVERRGLPWGAVQTLLCRPVKAPAPGSLRSWPPFVLPRPGPARAPRPPAGTSTHWQASAAGAGGTAERGHLCGHRCHWAGRPDTR